MKYAVFVSPPIYASHKLILHINSLRVSLSLYPTRKRSHNWRTSDAFTFPLKTPPMHVCSYAYSLQRTYENIIHEAQTASYELEKNLLSFHMHIA